LAVAALTAAAVRPPHSAKSTFIVKVNKVGRAAAEDMQESKQQERGNEEDECDDFTNFVPGPKYSICSHGKAWQYMSKPQSLVLGHDYTTPC
jgi:hypothetical protein